MFSQSVSLLEVLRNSSFSFMWSAVSSSSFRSEKILLQFLLDYFFSDSDSMYSASSSLISSKCLLVVLGFYNVSCY